MVAIVTIIVLIFGALRYKQNKAISIFLLFCMCLIMGLNYENPDYQNYVWAYENADLPYKYNILEIIDIGFKIIQALTKKIGITDYGNFRFILSFILFTIFGLTIINNCKYYNLYFIIYLIFYLALDEIQIRNFTSFVILLPFLIYYIKNQNLKGVLIYILGIFVAFTIHFSAVFYGIFILSVFKSKVSKIIFILIILIVLCIVGGGMSELAMINRVDHYNQPTTIGASVGCILLICNYIYVRWTKTFINKIHVRKNHKNTLFIVNYSLLIHLNLILVLLCPIIFMNATVLRIWRFISLLNLIYIINLLYFIRKYKYSWKLSLSALIYGGLISIWFNGEGVYSSMFNNPIFTIE